MTVRLSIALLALMAAPLGQPPASGIDRHALVRRHNPELRRMDVESPLSVGNGEIAFTADATGLQTFPEAYRETIPLGTLSQSGWHSAAPARRRPPIGPDPGRM